MQSSIPYILYIHSILRYFILFFAAITAFQSLVGMLGKKRFLNSHKMSALVLLIFCDLQLIFGLILYYIQVLQKGILGGHVPVNDVESRLYRFYGIEHSLSMVVAIILVHIGYSVIKKNIDDDRKFKRLFWCSFIALTIFMAMTPWAVKQVVGRPNVPVMPG